MKKLLHTNKLWSRMAALLLSCMVLLPGMATAEGDQCLEPYADPITLSMIYEVDVGVTFPEGDDIMNNVVTRKYAEMLNINYDLSWQVDAGSYTTQLNAAIGSNTKLPDMFMRYGCWMLSHALCRD